MKRGNIVARLKLERILNNSKSYTSYILGVFGVAILGVSDDNY